MTKDNPLIEDGIGGSMGLLSRVKRRFKHSGTQAGTSIEVTYDKSASALIWQLIEPAIKNRACPFCHRRLSIATFAGAAHINGEPRLLHNNLTCLIQYASHRRQEDVNDLANTSPKGATDVQ